MKYLLLCLLLGAGGAVYAEPEDSITVVISPDESIEFIRYVKEPDSTRKLSYSYADVLTEAVEITIFDEANNLIVVK